MTRKWSRSPSDNYRKRYSLRPVRPWRVAFFIGEDGSRISLEEVKSPPRRSAVLCNTPRGGMRFRGHGRNGGGKPPPYGVGDGTGSLPQSPAVTAPSSEGAEGILRCVALQEDGGCAAFGAATAKACLRPTGWGMGRGLSLSHGVRRDSSLIRGSLGGECAALGAATAGASPRPTGWRKVWGGFVAEGLGASWLYFLGWVCYDGVQRMFFGELTRFGF